MTPRAIASSLSLLLCLVLVLTVISSVRWIVDDHSNRGIVSNALLRNSTTNSTTPPAAAKHKRAKIYYREGTAYDRRQLKTSHNRDLSTTSYFEPQISTAIMPDESEAEADARLMGMLKSVMEPLPRFVPEA